MRLSLAATLAGGTMVVPLASSGPAFALSPIDCNGPIIAMTRGQSVVLLDTTEDPPGPGNSKFTEETIISGKTNIPGTLNIPNVVLMNQIGIRPGGKSLIFTGQDSTDSKGYLYDVDLTAPDGSPNQVKRIPSPGISVAGAVDLKSGKYFFGGYKNKLDPDGTPFTELWAYGEGDASVPEGQLKIRLPGAIGDNGDLMFDKDGNMFLLTSSAGTFTVFRVIATDYEPSGDLSKLIGKGVVIDAELIQQAKTSDGGAEGALNGIAFGNGGYTYASGNKFARKYDARPELVQAVELVGTDMASCVNPPSFTLYKNLPTGRAAKDDQFRIRVDGPGIDLANERTTFGSEKGLQEEFDPEQGVSEYVGPVLVGRGTELTISEFPEGGADLANYATSVECVDETTGQAVPVSGSGTTHTLKMPESPVGSPEARVTCVYTNEALASITVQKDLPQGRSADTDQFTLSISPGDASATTTGTASGIQAEKAILKPATIGETYTVTETAAGTTNLDYYDITWTCVDAANGNASVGAGTGPSGTFTVPDGEVASNVVCTFKNDAQPSDVVPEKSVDPASGTAVVAGQTLDYTVTFTNNGGGPGTVDYVDDISGVIDDAEITVEPKVTSGSALDVSAVADGKFTMKGELAPGATSSVTYSVKVLPDGQRNDNLLENFVLEPGTPTPEECVEGNPLCTENPVPELVMKKDVDPEDGSTVIAGQELTYTMTFDNTKGESAAPVDMVDNLVDVLDDATVTEEPKLATGSGLTVSAIADGQFTIKGSVDAGQVATVTYKVQVKPDNARGNSVLENFLLPPGNPPPEGGCPPGDPLCTSNPVPGPSVAKDVDPEDGSTVVVGQELLYTLTFSNSGAAAAAINRVDDLSGVLDDATIVEAPKLATGEGLSVSEIADGRFTITGEVAGGATATVTMKVVVKPVDERGDDVLLNFVLQPGEDKPEICLEGDPLCTENPVAQLTVVKDVDPPDGTKVEAGQELTYTVTFKNDGKGDAIVDKVDNLGGILDDAEVTQEPVLATGEGLTVSAIESGEFTIQGTLGAGKEATVTMKVVVKADGERGDNILLNFVLEPGKTPPEECEEGDPLCTDNRVPGLGVSKSVDPEDGSTVVAGQELIYTLTYTNTGAAAADVDEFDDLSDVLDDATLTQEPEVSGDGLTVSKVDDKGVFTIKGSVAPGATSTITMKVKVNADGARGNDDLVNFVVKSGNDKPDECVPGDPRCTDNPVGAPAISLVKVIDNVQDVDNNENNTVGDIVTYKFTVTNTGNVPLTDIKLVDPLLSNAPLTCPKTELAVKESMECSSGIPKYTITTGDLAVNAVNNTATVTGVDPQGKSVTAVDSKTLPVVPVVNPTIPTTTLKPSRPKAGSGAAKSFSMAAILSLGMGASLIALSRSRRQQAA